MGHIGEMNPISNVKALWIGKICKDSEYPENFFPVLFVFVYKIPLRPKTSSPNGGPNKTDFAKRYRV